MIFSMYLDDKIESAKKECALYTAVREYLHMMYINRVKTDAVYEEFCEMYPDVTVSKRRFTRIVCAELNLHVVQRMINGKRCYIYDNR